jgi:hypothetical protein
MDQMILSEPSIIIISTYQNVMEWTSRLLVGEMACADWDFGSGQMWLIFGQATTTAIHLSMIHMDQMILSEPSIIIIWTYQHMMEWTSKILVGEMAGADWNFGTEVGQMWLIFGQATTTAIHNSA